MDGQLPKPKANVAQSTQSFSSPEKHAPKPTSAATSDNDKVALDFAKKQIWYNYDLHNPKQLTYQQAISAIKSGAASSAEAGAVLQGQHFDFAMRDPGSFRRFARFRLRTAE